MDAFSNYLVGKQQMKLSIITMGLKLGLQGHILGVCAGAISEAYTNIGASIEAAGVCWHGYIVDMCGIHFYIIRFGYSRYSERVICGMDILELKI